LFLLSSLIFIFKRFDESKNISLNKKNQAFINRGKNSIDLNLPEMLYSGSKYFYD